MSGVQRSFCGVSGLEPRSTSALTELISDRSALAGELEYFFFYGFGSSEGWGVDGEGIAGEYACRARRNK